MAKTARRAKKPNAGQHEPAVCARYHHAVLTEYLGDICAGDTLTGVNRLENLEVRESKALGKMLITTQRATYTNQDGKVVAIQTGQAIYY